MMLFFKSLIPNKTLFIGMLIMTFSCSIYSQNLDQVIRTNPSGAQVLDDKNVLLGETPFALSKLKSENNKISIVKDDFNTIEISFSENKKKELLFPTSVIDCKGCVLEYDANQLSATIKLLKKFKENEKTILVGIDNPTIDIQDDVEIGKLNGNKRKLKDKDIYRLLGYPENMEMKMLNSFEDSYLFAEFFSKKDFKNNVYTLQSPKIILKPVVKKINFDLKGKLLRDYVGPCTIVCEWQISDLSDTSKILETYTTNTSFYRSENNYELLLHEMIALSERDLLENESLQAKLEKLQQDYLSKSKGEGIILKLSASKSYANSSQMLNEVKKSVVTIESAIKFGSGVFISDDGYILTNYHVVDGGTEVFVKIDKAKKIKAEIVKINKDFDLAILKINVASNGVFLVENVATSVGDEVFAIGTPLDKSLGQTVTKGIISGYREWNGVDFIQTDVSINSGNSGGPLLNSKGEIIGINTLKASGKNISGIGFAIPSEIILKMLNISNK